MSALPEEFDVPLTTGAVLSDSPFDVDPVGAPLDVGELEGDPAVAFRRTMGMFATGVTVITTLHDEQVHGMTANAFMSVSLSPPLVLISVDRRARLSSMLHEGTRYGVNVLAADQAGLSDRFAGRSGDFPEPSFVVVHDTPLVEGALAHVVARVVRSYWGGDHSLFVGHVEYAHYGEGAPLLFHGGRYERVAGEPDVFSRLPRELLDQLLRTGREQVFAPGETLMRRGDAGDSLMLITDGSVLVERPGKRLTLGPGSLVGEIEVLDPGSGRIATITAETDTTCIVVARDDLIAGLVTDPAAAVALLEILAGRFRETA